MASVFGAEYPEALHLILEGLRMIPALCPLIFWYICVLEAVGHLMKQSG